MATNSIMKIEFENTRKIFCGETEIYRVLKAGETLWSIDEDETLTMYENGVGTDYIMTLHAELTLPELKFTAVQAGSTVQMTGVNLSLQYSEGETREWKPFKVGETKITLSDADDVAYIRCCAGGNSYVSDDQHETKFVMTGRIKCEGNVRALLGGSEYDGIESKPYCFKGLFRNCSALISAPALPYQKLSKGCYQDMFSGCTNLIAAPELPAETLTEDCYAGMFSGCTNLSSIYTNQNSFTGCIGWLTGAKNETTCEFKCRYFLDVSNRSTNTVPSEWRVSWFDRKTYTPIEYLQSQGSQWIETGIRCQTGLTFDAKVFFTSINDDYFASCRKDSENTRFYMLNVNNSKGFVCTKSIWDNAAAVKPSQQTNVELSVTSYIGEQKVRITVNGTSDEIEDTSIPTNSNTLPLFGGKLNDSSTVVSRNCSPSGTRCYYAKFSLDDGTVLRDFIPVKDQDGFPCMYDKVSNEFFYNQGTSYFIAGPDLNDE